jgi:hypothetical protein
MEVLSLKRELATEKEARQAAAGRALTSADEAAAAVSLTLAVQMMLASAEPRCGAMQNAAILDGSSEPFNVCRLNGQRL